MTQTSAHPTVALTLIQPATEVKPGVGSFCRWPISTHVVLMLIFVPKGMFVPSHFRLFSVLAPHPGFPGRHTEKIRRFEAEMTVIRPLLGSYQHS